MTGNICRCSNYNRYVEAVLAAAATKNATTATGNSGRSKESTKPGAEFSGTKNRRDAAVSTTGTGGAR